MKKTARKLEKQGRGGDTLLAHINPKEATLLKAYGGSGTRNPKTGLLQFDGGGDSGYGGDSGPGYAYSGPGAPGYTTPGSGSDSGGGYGYDGYSGDTGGYSPGYSAPGSYSYNFAGDPYGHSSQSYTGQNYASTAGDGMIGTDAVADSMYGPGFSSGEPASFAPGPEMAFDQMAGFGGMTGESNSNYGGDTNTSSPGWAAGDDAFTRVMRNPFARFALAALAKSNPAVATAMQAYSMYGLGDAVAKGKGGEAFGKGMANTVGSTLGGAAGFNMAGPFGAVAGSYLGGKGMSQAMGNAGNASPSSASGGSFGSEAMGALGSYYAGKQASKSATKQINQLQGLYSPDSPYAQMARQRMERRDAAGGRRSQYGVRETELAALLADRQAQQAPQLQSLYNQKDQNRADMLRTGLTYYDRLGGYKGIKEGVGDVYDTVSGWF